MTAKAALENVPASYVQVSATTPETAPTASVGAATVLATWHVTAPTLDQILVPGKLMTRQSIASDVAGQIAHVFVNMIISVLRGDVKMNT